MGGYIGSVIIDRLEVTLNVSLIGQRSLVIGYLKKEAEGSGAVDIVDLAEIVGRWLQLGRTRVVGGDENRLELNGIIPCLLYTSPSPRD